MNHLPGIPDYREALSHNNNLMIDVDKIDADSIKEGAFGLVCPAYINGEKFALKLWKMLDKRTIDRILGRLKLLEKAGIAETNLYLLQYSIFERGLKVNDTIVPAMLQKWSNGIPLVNAINKMSSASILKVANLFLDMTNSFHIMGLSHGDFYFIIPITHSILIKILGYPERFF